MGQRLEQEAADGCGGEADDDEQLPHLRGIASHRPFFINNLHQKMLLSDQSRARYRQVPKVHPPTLID